MRPAPSRARCSLAETKCPFPGVFSTTRKRPLHWDLSSAKENTAFPILFAISFCHLLNDMNQSLLASLYPILKTSFHLDFSQIGLITLVFQITASLLQPVVGL